MTLSLFAGKKLPLAVVAITYLFVSFLTSCKKDPVNVNKIKSPINDTVYAALSDTGLKPAGATMDRAMFNDTLLKRSFTASGIVTLSDAHDMVINGAALTQISLFNCNNITIKNCKIGPNNQAGINLQNCTNITVDSCYIYKVATGIYAGYSQTIVITHCQARNMLGPFPQGQFVQFNHVSGSGNRVSFNKFENILGESYAEDAISMYASNGLPGDPILIESNWIRGGGPSRSGGGIILGDGGGSNIIARNNFLVDPGQYGMAVAGGNYMAIINNTIYAKPQSFTNVGLYYRNYSGPPSTSIVIAKNDVNYINSGNQVNTAYLDPGDHAPLGWTTNVYDATLDGHILPGNVVSGEIFGGDDPISGGLTITPRYTPGSLLLH